MGENTNNPAAKTTTDPEQPKPDTDITDVTSISPEKDSDDPKDTPEHKKAPSPSQSADHVDQDKKADGGMIHESIAEKDRAIDDFLFFCFQPLSW